MGFFILTCYWHHVSCLVAKKVGETSTKLADFNTFAGLLAQRCVMTQKTDVKWEKAYVWMVGYVVGPKSMGWADGPSLYSGFVMATSLSS